MAARGDVYDLVIRLPGTTSSGLTHHAFTVCTDEYIRATACAVLISTTRGSRGQVRPPFAFYINQSAYIHESGRPFETDREITPTLMATVPVTDLPARVGSVGVGFFSGEECSGGFGAEDALRVQFQLPGRMESLRKLYPTSARDVAESASGVAREYERLSVWSVSHRENPFAIVSNNKANYHAGIKYVQGVELLPQHVELFPKTRVKTNSGDEYCLGSGIEVFGKQSTAQRSNFLTSHLGGLARGAEGERAVDAHVMTIFGLV